MHKTAGDTGKMAATAVALTFNGVRGTFEEIVVRLE
jgi:hypothetical protein